MPNDNKGKSLSSLLHDAIIGALATGTAERVRIFPCDLDENGAFVRFAGTESACAALHGSCFEAEACPAILIVGLFPPPRADAASARERAAASLFDWAGARYLRYGFDRRALEEAADEASRGVEQPPPRGLLTAAADVGRRISEVRHWLENRLRNVDGTQVALDTALRGEVTLHKSHLDPVAAMTDPHRKMVERLWACDASVGRLAPEIGGLGAIRYRMDVYEHRWGDLECARAALRTAPNAERTNRLTAMGERLAAVREALAMAIEAMDDVDGKINVGDRG